MRNGAGALLAASRVRGSIGAQNRGATSPQFIAPRFLTSSLNKLSEMNWAAIRRKSWFRCGFSGIADIKNNEIRDKVCDCVTCREKVRDTHVHESKSESSESFKASTRRHPGLGHLNLKCRAPGGSCPELEIGSRRPAAAGKTTKLVASAARSRFSTTLVAGPVTPGPWHTGDAGAGELARRPESCRSAAAASAANA